MTVVFRPKGLSVSITFCKLREKMLVDDKNKWKWEALSSSRREVPRNCLATRWSAENVYEKWNIDCCVVYACARVWLRGIPFDAYSVEPFADRTVCCHCLMRLKRLWIVYTCFYVNSTAHLIHLFGKLFFTNNIVNIRNMCGVLDVNRNKSAIRGLLFWRLDSSFLRSNVYGDSWYMNWPTEGDISWCYRSLFHYAVSSINY